MKKFYFVIYLFFLSLRVFSQEFSKIVPVNPNVASLFKSTITPVNEYSGLANVSIPLYTVTEGAITVPLSLSYNNSGIQVSEESGIVGLGWTLNTGGAITRMVNGNDDFNTSSVGYLRHGKRYPDPYIFPEPDAYFDPNQYGLVNANSECKFLVNGNLTSFDQTIFPYYYQDYDFMPDVFYYSFNGYSGSFVLDSNANVVLMKKEGLKILVDRSGGSQSVKFTITTEDGTIYEFNKTEFTNFSGTGLGIQGYTSSWYLSKITDISGNHIDFIYENKENIVPLRSFTQNFEIKSCIHFPALNDSSQDCTNPIASFKEYAGPYTTIEGIYLSEIHFSNGKVKLNYSNYNVRTDLKGYYLNSIEIKDNTNNIVKRNDFNYSYFGNISNGGSKSLTQGDYSQSIYSLGSESHLNLRLRLDSVTEDSVKTHSFEYNSGYNNYVPNKTTLDQDYWGFYNGANNTRSFIPSVNPNISGFQRSFFVAANREPNDVHAKLFSLNKITYPTKGSTVFDYETNTFDKIQLATQTTTQSITAKADETTPYTVSVPFTPQIPFRIVASFVLQGWNSSMSPNKPYVNFPTTFNLKLKKADGTELRYYYFPSDVGNQQWNNVPGSSYAGYVYPAEEFGTQQHPISGNQFILEAYFNDQNGLLMGVANIRASWDELVSSYYSKGGGLRIKSISDSDSDGSLKMKRAFNYHYINVINGQTVQKSYGKLHTSKVRYEREHSYTYSGQINNQVRNPVIVGSSNSINVFSKDAGSYVGYDQVETVYVSDNVNNGKQIKKFYNVTDDLQGLSTPLIKGRDDYYRFPTLKSPRNGLNYMTENYKRQGNFYSLVSKIENDYDINGFSASNFDLHTLYHNSDYIIGAKKENFALADGNYMGCGYFQFQLYPYYSNLIQQTAIRETLYDINGQNPVLNGQKFYYENGMHLQKTRIESTYSSGEVLETKIYYPDDISSTASLAEGGNLTSYEYTQIDRLKADDLHRIATPIQTVTKRNGQITSIQRNLFKTDDGIVLPSSVLSYDLQTPTTSFTEVTYDQYDVKGNLLQYTTKDGIPTAIIWGYNGTQPIAKVTGAAYAQVSNLATAIITASDLDASNPSSEPALINALDAFRKDSGLYNYQITTYTYDPLIGVTSITPPSGIREVYFYDSANRLKEIKQQEIDVNGNVVYKLLKEYQYNYKH
ncbi:hypothetical protein [Chryseobacterium sp. 3008163]|uniref:hypothetical protein n=1 Tax=Chryseobacterium sp. 3008163 TaxID=2478663 RepID=UPI000F0C4872|nr:hypothetical protein [Chryseobacterium sp. 3008163]AYN01044.1 hypothetical protein EAG08_12650 [Chryseobacterium sp. 3008163]